MNDLVSRWNAHAWKMEGEGDNRKKVIVGWCYNVSKLTAFNNRKMWLDDPNVAGVELHRINPPHPDDMVLEE
ncbi:MAG: hypothetical protein N0C84_00990 [Candidatus Thiodiazotropha taylori]|uniref:Uncharacterized protein n=1 Tax=Candidatus Thiodiazotropha taylori TaxID=2792791 RepID=A0A9E4N235_9GAMM|nr:hypothetical protein [Candidatus Thiodiazotropha taylori]MCW4255021.1 hypothetical protein [Candidatus Thiodiazotropha taylori]